MMPYERDDELLMNLGYKPELKRNFSPLQVFGIAFSIMSLVPSIASVVTDGISAGGVGMTWGWFVPCIFIMSVGISLAELGSAMPTSGGLYWWTFKFAPAPIKKSACFLTGYANTLGLIGGLCSVDYGFAQMVLSVPAIATEGSFVPTKYMTYGVFVACIVLQACMAMIANRFMSKLQTFCILLNLVLVGLVCIALPIGVKHSGRELNSGKWVFTDSTNLYDWEYGWAFLLSWMAAIWTIGAFDSCIHMSEEASNAATAVPLGIILSIGMCWILGFVIQAILAACLNTTVGLEETLSTYTGQPMAQIIMDALGKKWAIGMMVIMFAVQFLMGLSILVAASRQTWAFSRDGALPFSRLIRKINLNRGIPINAIIFDTTVGIFLGLLVLIDSTAAMALFSLYSSSNAFSWLMPILMRVITFRRDDFVPGPFFLGHTISRINNIVSVVYLIFVVFVLTQMPVGKNVTKDTMNYTCVINPAVWIGCMIYYFVDAHKWFKGPKLTVGTIEGVEPDAIDENVVRMPKENGQGDAPSLNDKSQTSESDIAVKMQ